MSCISSRIMQRHLACKFDVLVENMNKLIMAAKPENKPFGNISDAEKSNFTSTSYGPQPQIASSSPSATPPEQYGHMVLSPSSPIISIPPLLWLLLAEIMRFIVLCHQKVWLCHTVHCPILVVCSNMLHIHFETKPITHRNLKKI